MSDQTTDRVAFVGVIGFVAFLFTQQALKLQRSETDRRLYELNNSHQRLDEAVAQNVSKDTWSAFVSTYEKDGDRHVSRFEQIERFQNKTLGAIALAVLVVPLVTGIVVYLLPH